MYIGLAVLSAVHRWPFPDPHVKLVMEEVEMEILLVVEGEVVKVEVIGKKGEMIEEGEVMEEEEVMMEEVGQCPDYW